MRPQLTNVAETELCMLLDCLEHFTLGGHHDKHLLTLPGNESFSSRGAYRAIQGEAPANDSMRIWATKLPSKIKFISWLLHRGRLNTRAHLHQRNIRTLEESWCAHCFGVLETDEHIFSECRKAQDLWARLGIFVQCEVVRRPWDIGVATSLPEAVRVDVILLILWHLWKARNAMIFDHVDSTSTVILIRITKDIDTWSCRYKKCCSDLEKW